MEGWREKNKVGGVVGGVLLGLFLSLIEWILVRRSGFEYAYDEPRD